MSRARRGQGSIYRETAPDRLTRWRGEKLVRLPDGTRKRVIVRGASAAEVEELLKRREAQLARAHPDAERQTAAQYFERWLEHQELRVKASSITESRRLVNFATSAFGHLPLSNVRPVHVQAAVDAALRGGRHATGDAVRRVCKQAFQQAVRWELLARNPAANIPPVAKPATVRGVLQPHQARAFMLAAEALHGGYFGLFYAALLTGMRLGELLALAWGDVSEASVYVHRTVTKGGIGSPKTRAGVRRIPIAPTAYGVLEASRRHATSSEWAFPSRTGTRLGARNVTRAFARTLNRAETPRIRFHDLRRTTASWWASSGVPPRVIQQLLGHATPHLALAIYTDVLDGQAESAAISPERWLSGGTNGGNRLQ